MINLKKKKSIQRHRRKVHLNKLGIFTSAGLDENHLMVIKELTVAEVLEKTKREDISVAFFQRSVLLYTC